jgi:hypothetical protein
VAFLLFMSKAMLRKWEYVVVVVSFGFMHAKRSLNMRMAFTWSFNVLVG